MKTALIVKEDGLIYVNEVPEEPSKPGSWAHQEFFTEYYEDDLPAYNKALASAKDSAVLCEDQEKAHGVIWRNYASQKDRQHGNELKPGIYPIPDLKWEEETIMSEGWQPTYNNPDNSGCEQPSEPIQVAILTLSEQPKEEESQEELFDELFSIYFARLHEGLSMYAAVKEMETRYTLTRKP